MNMASSPCHTVRRWREEVSSMVRAGMVSNHCPRGRHGCLVLFGLENGHFRYPSHLLEGKKTKFSELGSWNLGPEQGYIWESTFFSVEENSLFALKKFRDGKMSGLPSVEVFKMVLGKFCWRYFEGIEAHLWKEVSCSRNPQVDSVIAPHPL